jgi:predicted dehydrogenase
MKQQKISVALYGAGSMGSFHARVISSNPNCSLAYIVDSNSERGQNLSEMHNAKWIGDVNETLLVDAVVIASPTEFHFATAMRYINAGIPVLVEKPIGLNFCEVKELVSKARETRTVLKCGLVERFNPVIIKAMQITRNPIHFQSIRHSPYVPRIQSPVSGDLLIHDLDTFLRIFSVNAKTATLNAMATKTNLNGQSNLHMVNVMVGLSDTRTGILSASRLDHQKVRKIRILEEERCMELDLLYKTISVFKSVSSISIEQGLSDQIQTIIEVPQIQSSQEPLAAQLAYFLASISDYIEDTEASDLNSYLNVHEQIFLIDGEIKYA